MVVVKEKEARHSSMEIVHFVADGVTREGTVGVSRTTRIISNNKEEELNNNLLLNKMREPV